VLLVEDDGIMRAHMEAALADLGYRVHAVADPLGAWRLIANQHTFDLVLSDLTVQGRSALKLVTLLRRRLPGLRVLFASAHPMCGELAAFLEYEPHAALLAKPFGRHQIAGAVRALMDG
jgi:two-component system cell cycle sensor histidine kinase/response regulator CckA